MLDQQCPPECIALVGIDSYNMKYANFEKVYLPSRGLSVDLCRKTIAGELCSQFRDHFKVKCSSRRGML